MMLSKSVDKLKSMPFAELIVEIICSIWAQAGPKATKNV